MTTKRILLFTVILIFSFAGYGQNGENNTIINRSNELGLHAGSTTGLGLSFRHWSNKLGVQITAIPIKANEFQFISGGLTGMYSITNKKYHRFFLYLGNHVLLTESTDFWDGTSESDIKYNVGFGTGFEVGKKVRFNIMVGYGGYNLLDGQNYMLLPAIESGVYFKL